MVLVMLFSILTACGDDVAEHTETARMAKWSCGYRMANADHLQENL